MYRSHTCGELRATHIGQKVTLAGWVQIVRDKGSLLWVDLRDRYGVTQLFADRTLHDAGLVELIRSLGREFVIQAEGTVVERVSKNDKIATGDIEINLERITILNSAKTPPFKIEDDTDGGEDLRMKYRYLDLRRKPVRQNLELRHKALQVTRRYMDSQGFLEIETPVLIKSTPEGARDFVVPSRMQPGEFYALPQSPQTFKQLLMVSGYDKYFQIVKCFRDEALRADRQPEFTQIDCEMSFVEQEDILETFTGLTRSLFRELRQVELPDTFRRMTYADSMRLYGNDKPDLRFGMTFCEITDLVKGTGFAVFAEAELVVGIVVPSAADYTRKQLDELTDFVKRPQIGAKGLVYLRCQTDGSFKSSVDKFYDETALGQWADRMGAKAGDLVLLLSGPANSTRKQLSELRLEMGTRLGLRNKDSFEVLWVVDFPLLEWSEEEQRWFAMHHPFTSAKPEDIPLLDTDPGAVRANAYDLVINGVEIGGGSIRIHDREVQSKMFDLLGFTKEEALEQFGFLMEAFEFGAPPHGGIAFGFDRLCAMMGGVDSIRDFIAFPKNNAGRDVMIDAPAPIANSQLDELSLLIKASQGAVS